MKPNTQNPRLLLTRRSTAAIFATASFLFFLISSAPHRVHHLLEGVSFPESNNPTPTATVHVAKDEDKPKAQTATPSHKHSHSRHSHHSHDHGRDHDETNLAAANPLEPPAESAGSSKPLQTNAPKRDAQHDNSAKTDCIVQAAAQHAHGLFQECVNPPLVADGRQAFVTDRLFVVFRFNASPFSQRAPPVA